MKIFIYSGGEQENSRTNHYMKWLKDALCETDEVFLHTAREKLPRNGISGFDEIKPQLEAQMLSSDIVIFASPVYMHNTSGTMKSFLDAFMPWCHSMALAGKLGIAMSFSSGNGNEEVNEYVVKMLRYFGAAVVGALSFEFAIDDETTKKRLLDFVNAAKNADLTKIKVSDNQKKVYETYKNLYEKKRMVSEEEYDIMKRIGVEKCDNFQEVFENNIRKAK